MDFYSSGQPLFLDSQATAAKDTAIHEVGFQIFFKILVDYTLNAKS